MFQCEASGIRVTNHPLQLRVCCLELRHDLKVDVALVQRNDGVGAHSGEGVCRGVVTPTDVANVSREQSHKVKVSGLPG